MKILYLSIIAAAGITVIASVSFFSQIQYDNKPPCEYCPENLSPNQPLQILDITTEPAIVSIGTSFLIYADVSNPNPYSIYLNNGCVSSLSATFDKNVETKQGITCFAMSNEEVKSGQQMRIHGPSIGTTYNATFTGLTNAVITLTYQAQGKTETVTSSMQITISPTLMKLPPSQIISSNNNSTLENNPGNEIGIMAVGNQTFYFDALNDTITAYHNEPVQILFHDVVFTLFPHPFSVGPVGSCGGTGFGSDAKFSDGIHELLGIFVQGMPCLGNSTPTNLSTHINPQAGLTFYDGKIRLLVNTENKSNLSKECDIKFTPKPFELKVFPNGTSLTIDYTPVFLMKPNSTGKICTNNWRTISEMNYSGKVIAGIGKDSSVTQDVTVVASPDTITIDNTNKTIVYTITASNGSSGFYRFSPMFSNCGGIPIAIGYDLTHSFDNDFPWLWETVPCPLPVANTEITGLTGIDVAYITKEYR